MNWHRQTTRLDRRAFCAAIVAGAAIASQGQQAETSRDVVRLKPIAGRPYAPVITALSITHDGQLLAAAGDDHAIRLLDTDSMKTVRVLTGHRDWVRTLAFAPDGLSLLSSGHDGQLLRWQRNEDWHRTQLVADAIKAASLCHCPAGKRFAVVGFDSTILTGAFRGGDTNRIDLGNNDFRAVQFRRDGKAILVGGRDGILRVLDSQTGSMLASYGAHRRRIRACRYLTDGRIVSAGEDGRVVIVDPARESQTDVIHLTGTKLLTLVELPDGRLVVGGTDNVLRVLDTVEHQEIGRVEGHTGSIAALAVSEQTLYSAGFDTTIRRWALHELPGSDVIARQVRATDYRTGTPLLPPQLQ